jgi:hypothetical protein
MRASDTYTESLFTVSKFEDFIPQSHPLRPIRKMVNEALAPEGHPACGAKYLRATLSGSR